MAGPSAWTAAKHPAPGIRARGQQVAVQVARSACFAVILPGAEPRQATA
ncbi:hypothetical protein M2368_000758 [Arthrobacter sp. JUb119]|nr:hypothetical protein [Arthrobacter sp. MYb214]MCS3491786.1 hypothetical protein [Arthrobacter sp. JUb119]